MSLAFQTNLDHLQPVIAAFPPSMTAEIERKEWEQFGLSQIAIIKALIEVTEQNGGMSVKQKIDVLGKVQEEVAAKRGISPSDIKIPIVGNSVNLDRGDVLMESEEGVAQTLFLVRMAAHILNSRTDLPKLLAVLKEVKTGIAAAFNVAEVAPEELVAEEDPDYVEESQPETDGAL